MLVTAPGQHLRNIPRSQWTLRVRMNISHSFICVVHPWLVPEGWHSSDSLAFCTSAWYRLPSHFTRLRCSTDFCSICSLTESSSVLNCTKEVKLFWHMSHKYVHGLCTRPCGINFVQVVRKYVSETTIWPVSLREFQARRRLGDQETFNSQTAWSSDNKLAWSHYHVPIAVYHALVLYLELSLHSDCLAQHILLMYCWFIQLYKKNRVCMWASVAYCQIPDITRFNKPCIKMCCCTIIVLFIIQDLSVYLDNFQADHFSAVVKSGFTVRFFLIKRCKRKPTQMSHNLLHTSESLLQRLVSSLSEDPEATSGRSIITTFSYVCSYRSNPRHHCHTPVQFLLQYLWWHTAIFLV